MKNYRDLINQQLDTIKSFMSWASPQELQDLYEDLEKYIITDDDQEEDSS